MNPNRNEFLMKMYDQLMNDINRHLTSLWQSVAVLVGGFAIFGLLEKKVVREEFVVTTMIIVCIWQILHVLDASNWYNRNLVIIANIEKEFLVSGDEKLIHCYFVTHRKENKMISLLKIQKYLGISIAVLMNIYYLDKLFDLPASPVNFGFIFSDYRVSALKMLPFIVSLSGAILIKSKHERDKKEYENFVKNSPGKKMSIQIDYEGGHGQ